METDKGGKRAKQNKQSTKRFKTSDDTEYKFIKACKGVSENAYFNYNKRLKLLALPKCNTCTNTKSSTSADPSPMSQLVENFVNELKVNMWYEALETCYYSITPTQYLPEKVLMGIVEIILNARENNSTYYSMVQIINKCQQILSYHFTMHPPCNSHREIMSCYEKLVKSYIEVKEQKYSRKNDYGHTHGIIHYCFNRLEHEICAESDDNPLYSKDYIDVHYEKIVKEVGTKKHVSIQRLNWEQENFEIYEMLNRTERINRLMATLYSMVELIQFDIYKCISNKKINKSFLYFLLKPKIEKDKSNEQKNIYKLDQQIMKMFAYLIHLDYPEDHIKTMSLWLNAMIEVNYFKGEDFERDFPKKNRNLTLLETQFYEIIKKLPHKSIIKILERIEPSYMKYYISLKYIQKNLDYFSDNVIEDIHTFIIESHWEKIPETNEHFITNDTSNIRAKDFKANDILKHLSMICKNANLKYHEKDKYLSYEKFDENCLSQSEMTQNDAIKALYISLEAFLDAYNVQKVHDAVQRNIPEVLTTSYEVTEDLKTQYSRIYIAQNKVMNELKKQEDANELPKFLECFKMMFYN